MDAQYRRGRGRGTGGGGGGSIRKKACRKKADSSISVSSKNCKQSEPNNQTIANFEGRKVKDVKDLATISVHSVREMFLTEESS